MSAPRWAVSARGASRRVPRSPSAAPGSTSGAPPRRGFCRSAPAGQNTGMSATAFSRLRARNEWRFFAVLPRADALLATLWWLALLLRGVLPVVLAVAMGVLVAAV